MGDFLGVGLGEDFDLVGDLLADFDVDFLLEEELGFDVDFLLEEELGFDVDFLLEEELGFDVDFLLEEELGFDVDFGVGRGFVEEDGLLTGLIVSRDLIKAAFFCSSLICARRLDGSPQTKQRRTIKLMDFEVRTPKVSKVRTIFKIMR